MKVLCAGDIHIGRRPSRLPSGVNAGALSCASAWSAIVECAIAERVDLVALSGDVVDQDNRFFEALGPLERGLRRLGEEGIPTVSVAGNHDYNVLPTLARQLPAATFQLLGAGGTWERTTVTSRDRSHAIHVDGWSFPRQHVVASPLDPYTLSSTSELPVLGLLHCDLAVGSSYAPVTLPALRALPPRMWLLGHVHAAALHEADGQAPVLYPGSPQPMDPGETGVHGAWLVDLRTGIAPAPRLLPLATVRYDALDVDLAGAATVDEARLLVLERLRDAAERMAREGEGALRHLSFRVRLTGRSSLRRELEADGEIMTDLDIEVDRVAAHVERVVVATRPAMDLDGLSKGSDALALLARLVRDADGALGDAAQEDLLKALQAVPTRLRTAKPYRSLKDDDGAFDSAALRALLVEQAGELLDTLHAQQEATA